jgi:hypothetical protein
LANLRLNLLAALLVVTQAQNLALWLAHLLALLVWSEGVLLEV